jgi:hypothetical protein
LVRAQRMIEGEKEFLTVFERRDYTRAVFLSKSNYCRKYRLDSFPGTIPLHASTRGFQG